jgi:fatty acid desaturase
MKDIFFFDSMLTPKIITFAYWFLLLVVCIAGLCTIFGGWGGITFGKFLLGIAIIIGGAVTARIWCELLIVLFKIDENIKIIADK